jgi:hypothetical protein
MNIRTALGPLALAWAATAGLSLLPAAAQTTKSSQHNQASVAPASLLATLQKDLKAELKGQEDECLPLRDHVDISRFDLGPTREAWYLEGHYPCFGGNDIWDQLLYVRAARAGVGFSMLPALRCRSAREPIRGALSQSGPNVGSLACTAGPTLGSR